MQNRHTPKNIVLLIVVLLTILIVVDRYYWAQLAQWREDQATNLWLGYTAGLRHIPVGLVSSTEIPNPNGMILLHGTGRVLKADQSKSVTLMATLSPFRPAFTEVDQEGNIYVSDSLNAAIYRISGGAVTVFASGFSGKSHPPVIGPTGMAFDSAGAMYVADGDRLWKISRIVPFELTYNFSAGFHVYGQEPIPQLNGFDYYFTPLMLNPLSRVSV